MTAIFIVYKRENKILFKTPSVVNGNDIFIVCAIQSLQNVSVLCSVRYEYIIIIKYLLALRLYTCETVKMTQTNMHTQEHTREGHK